MSNNELQRKIKELESRIEKLQDETTLFNTILNNLPFGIQIFDEKGTSYKINEAQKELLGLPDLSEGVGKFNVLTDGFSKKNGAARLFEQACRGKKHQHTFEFNPEIEENKWNTRKDSRLFSETIFPVKGTDGKVKYVVAVLNDITEKSRNEQKLNENEQHLRLLIENAPDAIFIQTDSKFRYLNLKAVSLFGAENASQLIGKSVLERFHPDYHHLIKERIRELNKKKITQPRIEELYLRLDGSQVDVEVSAVPFKYYGEDGALVFAQDITERKQIEKKLKDSFNLLKNLAAQVPGVVYQYRLYPDGRSAFPYSSLGMYDIYEVTSEEVREDASPVFTRIHPDDYDFIVKSINESAQNQTVYHSEFRVVLPGQGLRWRHCDAKPELLSDGSTLWHGIITDITDRKKIEQEMKKTSEELENFFSCAIDLLCIATTEGFFIRLNREWENVLGYTLSELEGKNIFDFIHPEDIESTLQTMNQLKGQEKVSSFVNRYRCKNGDYKWIEWKSFPSGNIIYAAARDITERKLFQEELIRKNAELEASEDRTRMINEKLLNTLEALKENENKLILINKELELSIQKHKELEERLEFSLNSSHTGAWEIDLKNHLVIRTPEHDKIFGYKEMLPEWTIDRFLYHVIESYREEVKEKFSKAVENKSVWDIECQIKRCDGEIRWIWACGQHIVNEKRGIHRVAGIIQDITERKISEIELLAAKEKAEESNRLKVAFLQNMSHEIRTPMNAIIGFSEMLKNSVLTPQKRENFADIIVKSSNQLLSVVTDIITISSIETGQEKLNLSETGMNSILDHLFTVFTPLVKEANLNLFVKKGLSDDKAQVYTDGSKVTQIITNLLSNSIKFTPSGFIEFGYELLNSDLLFFVKDTGIGIDKSLHDKIFERFRQADLTLSRKYGGTGLGLSISKGLLELMGGKIRVESVPGEGSVFYFTIPYHPVHFESNNHPQISEIRDSYTILVAEDEDINFFLIEEILSDTNLKLLHAKNGSEALDIFYTHEGIDLILMDIKMPVMDGYTATRIIKKHKPELPVIAQTAYALENEIKKYEGVFDSYMTKPISKEKLKQVINMYIKKL